METAEHEVFILSILFILSKRSSLVAAGRAGPSVVELLSLRLGIVASLRLSVNDKGGLLGHGALPCCF